MFAYINERIGLAPILSLMRVRRNRLCLIRSERDTCKHEFPFSASPNSDLFC